MGDHVFLNYHFFWASRGFLIIQELAIITWHYPRSCSYVYFLESHMPSCNRTWQWKIHQRWVSWQNHLFVSSIFSSKPCLMDGMFIIHHINSPFLTNHLGIATFMDTIYRSYKSIHPLYRSHCGRSWAVTSRRLRWSWSAWTWMTEGWTSRRRSGCWPKSWRREMFGSRGEDDKKHLMCMYIYIYIIYIYL